MVWNDYIGKNSLWYYKAHALFKPVLENMNKIQNMRNVYIFIALYAYFLVHLCIADRIRLVFLDLFCPKTSGIIHFSQTSKRRKMESNSCYTSESIFWLPQQCIICTASVDLLKTAIDVQNVKCLLYWKIEKRYYRRLVYTKSVPYQP